MFYLYLVFGGEKSLVFHSFSAEGFTSGLLEGLAYLSEEGGGSGSDREVSQLKRTKEVEIWKYQLTYNTKKRRFRRVKRYSILF